MHMFNIILHFCFANFPIWYYLHVHRSQPYISCEDSSLVFFASRGGIAPLLQNDSPWCSDVAGMGRKDIYVSILHPYK